MDEFVLFLWTPTSFGGQRRWFRCPGCGRKSRVLYGGTRYRCRRCHQVRYGSQSEMGLDRAARAMAKIARQLDPEADYDDLPWKPKGMHWRTYNRLAQRHRHYDAQWGFEARKRFGIKL